jgi:leucyl aminopeptidase
LEAINKVFQQTHVPDSIMIDIVMKGDFESWLSSQTSSDAAQVRSQCFRGQAGDVAILVGQSGAVTKVCAGMGAIHDVWLAGSWVRQLPEGTYHIHSDSEQDLLLYALAWGMGAYDFTRYRKAKNPPQARLMLDRRLDQTHVITMLSSIYWVRDLINTPAQDLMPTDMVDQAKQMAKLHKAKVQVIAGDKLLKQNYPAIHAVGRGSMVPPHLIDMRWGEAKHPRLTLIGKGVCFDTGGLDIKPAAGMLQMKKDMGGAAHALALAHLVMSHKLPVCLRVLIPTVENAVSARAYHPGDVIDTRAGLTVEVGNTDAEGRLILADALTEASSEDPDLLIDFATLTGAQRIALGEDLPAYFTGNADLIQDLMRHSQQVRDPSWPLPLYLPYADKLKSSIADLNNITPGSSFGGSITAALFLAKFVGDTSKWVHFDFNAWNEVDKPSRPFGGEAMALRMMFSYLKERYQS